MNDRIFNQVKQAHLNRRKQLAVLLDPDKINDFEAYRDLIKAAASSGVDYFLVGGSLITTNHFSNLIRHIKEVTSIPVIIFPGSNLQIDSSADALLFLSLISGRNPEMLIGQHVVAAPVLKRSKLEIIPTGYMLVNSGRQTAASYLSNTTPIPADKPTIAACTAMAGEMLGLKLIYLDAGSGAEAPVPARIISMVRKSVNCPLIVGGGIRSRNKAFLALEAGADTLVIGNGVEQSPGLIEEVSNCVSDFNQQNVDLN
jgi:phosphoglycerol geranylgeranyltransferase